MLHRLAIRPLSLLVGLISYGIPVILHAQQPPSKDDSVVRINTELVQTDLMVFDKHGHFVDGLRPEDFAISVGGKQQNIQFFQRVAAGSAGEENQLTAARSANLARSGKAVPNSDDSDRARMIFFFVDDTHLHSEGILRARKALLDFVENRMGQNDQVAIVSTSGQIGFLQQLTDNKVVLRTAISRLVGKRDADVYPGKTRITEYMASQIENHNDKALFAYLLESTKLEQQMGAGSRHGDHRTSSSYSAGPYLANRLRQINGQARLSSRATLATLQGLLATTAGLPGRKLLFFLSDGFIVNPQDSDNSNLLRRVTEAAGQTGTVIYSIDLRDSSSGSSVDLSTNDYIDFSGRQSGLLLGEITANREPLRVMADETGGRTILNPDSITEGMIQALDETANYYLLAWRPETGDQREGKVGLNVTIKDHPEWRVRLRRKFYASSPAPVSKKTETQVSAQQKRVSELQGALGSLYPQRQAPLQLSVGYIAGSPVGGELKLSMQLDPRLFATQLEGERQKAELDVLGAAVDDRGIISTFKQVLTITPETLIARAPVIWHQQLLVPAGLYQVRVAVRDRELGWTGSAMQWIEVPDFSQGSLQMSSLFIGGRGSSDQLSTTRQPVSQVIPQPVKVSVDHRFPASSILRFQTYLYAASQAPATTWSGLEVEAGVMHNGRPVVVMPSARVPRNTLPNQPGWPYWAEVPLEHLVAGRYVLTVTAFDRDTKSHTSQQINFTIE
jgi:VWFA-related protein